MEVKEVLRLDGGQKKNFKKGLDEEGFFLTNKS